MTRNYLSSPDLVPRLLRWEQFNDKLAPANLRLIRGRIGNGGHRRRWFSWAARPAPAWHSFGGRERRAAVVEPLCRRTVRLQGRFMAGRDRAANESAGRERACDEVDPARRRAWRHTAARSGRHVHHPTFVAALLRGAGLAGNTEWSTRSGGSPDHGPGTGPFAGCR